MIEFNCEICGKAIRVKDEYAGKMGRCNGCGNRITIPEASPPEQKLISRREGDLSNPKKRSLPAPVPATQATVLPAHGVAVQVNVDNSQNSDGLGISSLIVGVLSFLVCWIPFVNFALGGLGLLLGIAGIVLAFKRKGNAIGFSIAGIAISTFSFLIGLLYFFMFAKVMSLRESSPESKPKTVITSPEQMDSELTVKKENMSATSPVQADEKWAVVPEEVTIGNVKLKVVTATIGKLPLIGIFGNSAGETTEEHLLIRLQIKNLGVNKKVDYRSWRSNFASIAGITAKLTDEHGNKYRFVQEPSGSKIKGANDNDSIYPQKEIDDVVAFETPISTARTLYLRLSATGCDEKGEFLFQIPRSFVQATPVTISQVIDDRQTDTRQTDIRQTDTRQTETRQADKRTVWINDTYKSRIVKVGPKRWHELRNGTNELLWHYDERSENAEYIEVYLVERKQTGRIYSDRLELFIGNNWINAAGGKWEK